jgi:predicted nucleic acid-binding protein
MKYLLDTDTCVFALRGDASVRQHLDATAPEEVAISVVTLAELRYGAACSAKPSTNHQVIDDFISGVLVLGLDGEVARAFGEFKSQLRLRGALIDDFDLLIAATAHRYGMTVITHNRDHFARVHTLPVEDWVHA